MYEIKQHAFFSEIDWELLDRKAMPAPFIPLIKNRSDVSQISAEFTQMSLDETPEEDNRLSILLADEEQFKNFTYVNEESLINTEQADAHYENQ